MNEHACSPGPKPCAWPGCPRGVNGDRLVTYLYRDQHLVEVRIRFLFKFSDGTVDESFAWENEKYWRAKGYKP